MKNIVPIESFYAGVRGKADEAAKWLAAALGFSIPISTAGDNIILALVLALWLLGANFKNKFEIIKKNSIALLALAMFGLYAIGLTYGTADKSSIMDTVHLLVIPLFITLFQDEKVRRCALWGFLSAMLITLLLSYLLWLDLLPAWKIWKGNPADPGVFKTHITHSILMAFAAYLFLLLAIRQSSLKKRLLFITLAALAVANVLFMVQGRTGQLVVLMLVAFSFWNWQGLRRWGKLIIPAVVVALLLAAAIFLPSSSFQQRFAKAASEFYAWQPGVPSPVNSSIGLRMEFYTNSLEIIRENPIFGVGTGDFAKSYAAQVKNTGMILSDNPHNDYLMTTVELGVIGLGLLLLFYFQQWCLAAFLTGDFDKAAARGLVLFILVGGMVDSIMIDHTDGLFYLWMSALFYATLSSGKTRPRVHKA